MNIPSSIPWNVPVVDHVDVLVAGGGPAGCAAAAAAAREGASVLLIEGTTCLGGSGTAGMVPCWCPFTDGEKIIYKGLAEQVFLAARATVKHEPLIKNDWVSIDPEQLKRVYDDLLESHGVRVLFGTQLVGALTDGRRITAAVVANKAGITAYQAHMFVDATGDADLVAYAGGGWEHGDPETGECQPATLCFALSNVDSYAYLHGERLHNSNPNSPVHSILKSGRYPLLQDSHFCNNLTGPNTLGFNAFHIWNVMTDDPQSLSDAYRHGRRMACQATEALREFVPAVFANAHLCQTASLLGIRESRRIVGEYCLTADDYAQRRTFEDEIGRNCYYMDVHLSRAETALDAAGKLDHHRRCRPYGKGESHGIPYRCLIPRDFDNVLAAGRSISCERMVQGSIRIMPASLVTGEAAGTAAGLAAVRRVGSREVSVAELRRKLLDYGAYFV